jgi:polygalacturonase
MKFKKNQMKIPVAFITLFLTVFGINSTCQARINKTPWEVADSIKRIITEPAFRTKIYNIVDFGALAGGKIKNTKAINAAITKCSEEGGGQVLVANGKYLTGAIKLKSNVDLHIEAGAVLVFSTNPKDYLPLVRTRWEGDDCYNYSPLIYSDGQTNIAVTGKGLLDGQGSTENWWPWKGGKSYGWVKGTPSQLDRNNRPQLKKYNDKQVPVEKRQMGEGSFLRRSLSVLFIVKM